MKYAGVEQLPYEEQQKNIKIAESRGNFNCEIQEPDWRLMQRVDENFQYKRKGFLNALATIAIRSSFFALAKIGCWFLIGSGFRGRKNLRGVKNAVFVCNHVHNLDNEMARWMCWGHKLYIVVAEFNNMNTFLGSVMRAGGIFPLSGNFSAMKKFTAAVNEVLHTRRGSVLFFPEKSMWPYYEQPRPFMDGAFHAAALNNVPVVPLFIVWHEPRGLDKLFFKRKRAEMRALKPIYPKAELSRKENIAYLRDEAFKEQCECYKEYYGREPDTKNAKFTLEEIFQKGYEAYLASGNKSE
ncbi:MAG: 1-acyl-sn-glycerol-3-phosphate acyltransferase [Treponema sp.]|nr:1-acyl-sn-glycerol-3-phosphate acyltransferase [Treponema sp.]